MVSQMTWIEMERDPEFIEFVQRARAFDPLGFDRAMAADERTGTSGFRHSVVEAYLEELEARARQCLDERASTPCATADRECCL